MTDKTLIHAKLKNARKAFHATSIKKTGRNTFSNYDYFELADFLIPAMDILAENDLIAVTSFETELATMTVTDFTTGESFVITSPMSTATLKACQPVQSMGACQTFVRRYLYTTLFEIVEHDAIEPQTGSPEPKQESKPIAAGATEAQRSALMDYGQQNTVPPRRAAWLDKQENWDAMTEAQARTIINECKKEESK
jgi:hypothetical protein